MERERKMSVQKQEAIMAKQEIATPGATPRRTPVKIGL
jgi:pre-mRNA-splicing factor ATP-dependent RNA helicase DHX38/PRP16